MLTDWHYRQLCIELAKRGYRTSEPNSIARETSQVLRKVWQSSTPGGLPGDTDSDVPGVGRNGLRIEMVNCVGAEAVEPVRPRVRVAYLAARSRGGEFYQLENSLVSGYLSRRLGPSELAGLEHLPLPRLEFGRVRAADGDPVHQARLLLSFGHPRDAAAEIRRLVEAGGGAGALGSEVSMLLVRALDEAGDGARLREPRPDSGQKRSPERRFGWFEEACAELVDSIRPDSSMLHDRWSRGG